MKKSNRPFLLVLLLSALLTTLLVGCSTAYTLGSAVYGLTTQQSTATDSADSCPVTTPVWIKPPADAAVLNPPTHEYFFVNADHSIWASAWWATEESPFAWELDQGIKVGWYRPAGAQLKISGRRLDGEASPLRAEIPCCYPTQFQATGLFFPAPGCWEVTAQAADKELSFVVNVETE